MHFPSCKIYKYVIFVEKTALIFGRKSGIIMCIKTFSGNWTPLAFIQNSQRRHLSEKAALPFFLPSSPYCPPQKHVSKCDTVALHSQEFPKSPAGAPTHSIPRQGDEHFDTVPQGKTSRSDPPKDTSVCLSPQEPLLLCGPMQSGQAAQAVRSCVAASAACTPSSVIITHFASNVKINIQK